MKSRGVGDCFPLIHLMYPVYCVSFSLFTPGTQVIKNFLLKSAKHEILNAHYYKMSRNSDFLSRSHMPRMLFFMFINVKMPTIIGILTFMSMKSFMLSKVEREKFYNLGARNSFNLIPHPIFKTKRERGPNANLYTLRKYT